MMRSLKGRGLAYRSWYDRSENPIWNQSKSNDGIGPSLEPEILLVPLA
jgi:hypothetical protein